MVRVLSRSRDIRCRYWIGVFGICLVLVVCFSITLVA